MVSALAILTAMSGTGGVITPPAPSLSITKVAENTTDTTTGTNRTYTGVNFGTEDSSRILVACLTRNTATLSNVTIGGVAATQVSGMNTMWYAVVPSGTSGTISIDLSSSQRSGYVLYSIIGATSSTPAQAVTGTSSSLPSIASIGSASAAIAMNNGAGTSTGTSTWGGTGALSSMSKDHDDVSSTGLAMSCASCLTTTGSAGVTYSRSGSGILDIYVAIWS